MSGAELPIELQAPVPRRVRWRAMAYVNATFWLAFFVALPLLLIASARREAQIDATLAQRGQIAQGRVWDKSDRTASRAKHPHRQYRIYYDFPAGAEGRAVSGEDFVSEDEYSRVNIHDSLAILYDPSHPATSQVDYPGRLAFRAPQAQLATAVDVAISSAGIGAALAIYVAMTVLPRRRLLRSGVAVKAEITGGERRLSGSRRQAQLSYQFADAQGVTVVGYARRSRAYLEGPTSRDRVVAAAWRNPVVLFDPNDSGANMLYGPDLYLKVAPAAQTKPSALASDRASRASK